MRVTEPKLIQGLLSHGDSYYFLLAQVVLARYVEEKMTKKGG